MWSRGRIAVSIGGDLGGQRIAVARDRFGALILTSRMPRQAGRILQPDRMLDPAQRLPGPPAAVVRIGKCRGREERRIQ